MRNLKVKSKPVIEASEGDFVEIFFDEASKLNIGDKVYKVRSNELKRETQKFSQAPKQIKLKPDLVIDLIITSKIEDDGMTLNFEATCTGKKL